MIAGHDRMGRPIRRSDPYQRVMAQSRREGECLVFTGYRNRDGYGRVSVGGRRSSLAHRVVWRHHNPDAPEPEAVIHSCDNPPCVDIAHLRAGTRADNSADMVAKGRSADVRGEKSGRAKLTDLDVELMRAVRELGYTTVEIGRVYGIHPSYVSRLVRGKRRKFLVRSEAECLEPWR